MEEKSGILCRFDGNKRMGGCKKGDKCMYLHGQDVLDLRERVKKLESLVPFNLNLRLKDVEAKTREILLCTKCHKFPLLTILWTGPSDKWEDERSWCKGCDPEYVQAKERFKDLGTGWSRATFRVLIGA